MRVGLAYVIVLAGDSENTAVAQLVKSVETVALTVNEYGPLVGRWFNESDRAPFPVGTLLLFTHID